MSTDPTQPTDPQFLIVDPSGEPARANSTGADAGDGDEDGTAEGAVTDLVEEPAKVMRIGSMIRMLLEEVKSAPLDEAGRSRLAGILSTSIDELKGGLAPELGEELDRMFDPFSDETPSESELRIAQAQLVGWLEGLFHGIQTAIYAQQMAARAQLEQMRRALPGGQPGEPAGDDGAAATPGGDRRPGGMYL